MEDFSNLEKMGRELKCPICLSLLTSSVSLVCNHVFCNTCIQKSMKSASDCPICKLPFHRREIRPAPHMDTLVSIYKSMEVSSGVNIFSTQIAPSSKELEQEPQNGKSCQTEPIKQRKAKGKSAKWSMSASPKISKSLMNRPSFPTKKRIQVTKHHIPETPKVVAESSNGLRGKSVLDGEGETGLAPFFWLREEEDVEKLTQQTDDDTIFGTPPCAPCFSDIKDSDDDVPDDLALQDEADCEVNNENYVDSEMFEWTQRPCSPELGSSPLKTQIKSSSQTLATSVEKENEKISVPTLSTQRTGTKNRINEAIESSKSGKGRRGRPSKKQVKGTKVQGFEVHVDLSDKTENPLHSDNNKGSSIHLKERTCMRNSFECDINGGNQNTTENSTLPENFTRISKKKNLLMKNSENIEGNATHPEHGHGSRCSKKRRTSDCSNPKVGLAKDALTDADNSAKLNQTMGKVQNDTEIKVLQNSSDKEIATNISNTAAILKCDNVPPKVECGFCHSAEETEFSGVMVHYLDGKPVDVDHNSGSKAIHAHRNCTEWAPNVYFEDDKAINLVAELARSRRIKCSFCGIRGAALGCYDKSCRKSFHVPCAKLTTQCRWDSNNFVMLCPLHASAKLPCELSDSQVKKISKSTPKRICEVRHQEPVVENSDSNWHWGSSKRYVICSSALTNVDKQLVSEFERISGIQIMKNWDPTVTHIIASADENGACKRTLKILMGILEGKWILKAEWIKACLEAMQPVDEHLYEINCDVHGIKDGPQLGRLRVSTNQSKPFEGCKFFLAGEYTTSYKGYLQDLVAAAGGVVLQRKPISSSTSFSSTFIVYSLELPEKCNPIKKNMIFNRRKTDAEAIANSTGSIVVSNSWVLNSIAGCKIRPLTG
ncbi:protein BREAST CANCER SUSCEPTIBILITY 1 homolog [Impatiens glandulifera]|uniref:protein BREAST CANCER SUSCEPTIBILITY 1 homolog n=1 Tax=Impatiens glandulifera TaxID=253017 RepID=UPI001FB16089|nr:protein BREAST CANCER SUSCEPTIBILITY 1 homolog [Impatiens glandulifera]